MANIETRLQDLAVDIAKVDTKLNDLPKRVGKLEKQMSAMSATMLAAVAVVVFAANWVFQVTIGG